MGKKGYPNIPGIPQIWDEVKKKVGIALTPTAAEGLDRLAKEYNLSKSEFIEQIARGIIRLDRTSPIALAGLDKLATEHGLSRSELVEQIGRGIFSISKIESTSEQEKVQDSTELVA